MIPRTLGEDPSEGAPSAEESSRTPGSVRNPAPLAWAAAAVAFAIAGQFYLSQKLPALDATLFWGASLLAFWRALSWVSPSPHLVPGLLARAATVTQSRHQRVIVVLAAGLFLATWAILIAGTPQIHPLLLAIGAGGLWILAGAALDGGFSQHIEALSELRRRIALRDLLVLSAILLLAAIVRLYHLDQLPYGLWYDEAGIGLEGHKILTDPSYRPLYAPSTTSPAAFVYLVAGAESLLGQTMLAVRVVPALAGVLTTLLAYLVGHKLWGPWAGLCAAALFAAARWDITFSRIGLQGATTPVLMLLVCLLAVVALSTRKHAAYAALGASVGLTFWFYSANLFFPLVLLILLIGIVIQERNFLAAHRTGIALAVGGTLLVAAPVLLLMWREPQVAFDRSQQASIFRDKTPSQTVDAVRENLWKHLLMFQVAGDSNGRHNLPQAPMLDWITSAAMLFGITASLKQWRDRRSILLVSWLLVMLLPAVLSVEFEAPQSLRAIGALPAALLLATTGFERFRALLVSYFGPMQAKGFVLLSLALVVTLNIGLYFGWQAQDFAVWSAYSTVESTVGRYLAAPEHQSERTLVSVFYSHHPSVDFFAKTSYEVFHPNEHIPIQGNVTTTLFLAPQEESVFLLLQQLYPEGDCQEERRQPNEPVLFYRCTVSADVQRATRVLLVSYSGLQPIDQAIAARTVVPFAALPSSSPTGAERAELAGSLLAPGYGSYGLALEGPATATLFLDGRSLLIGGGEPVTIELARGLHGLRIVSAVESITTPVQALWQPPQGQWSAIPRELLFHGTVRPLGLVASYYRGEGWEGAPVFRWTEAAPSQYFHVPPIERPFSIEWTGSLNAGAAGTYQFSLEAISYAQLEVDGRPILATAEQSKRFDRSYALEAGWHRIRVRYRATDPYSQVYVHWQAPGGQYQSLPPEALRPW